jgi:6-phosphofructokinase 2
MFDAVTLTLNPAIDLYTSVAKVESEHKLRCDEPQIHAGGGGVNVTRVMARFGRRALALYAAGGRTGEWLEDLLALHGIEQERIAIGSPARENVTVLDRSTSRQFRFVMPGMDVTEPEWRACLERAVDRAWDGRDPDAASSHDTQPTAAAGHRPHRPSPPTVVASGSLPRGVPDDFYARLAAALASPAPGFPADVGRRAADGGGDRHRDRSAPRLVLDTAGPALRAAVDHGVYLVAPNRRELDELAGRELEGTQRHRFAEKLLSDGRAEIVVVKLDSDGALAASSDIGVVEVAAPHVSVLSAVGAGDSFLGALVSALESGWRLDDAVRLAIASGSAACTKPGTELADLESVHRLWPQVSDRPMPSL